MGMEPDMVGPPQMISSQDQPDWRQARAGIGCPSGSFSRFCRLSVWHSSLFVGRG